MLTLALASAFFAGIHLIVSGTPLRNTLIAMMGERVYQALFSLASVVGLVWMIRAYPAAKAEADFLWMPPQGLVHSAPLLILIAFLFVVIGALTPNPTSMMSEGRLSSDKAVTGIIRITRHPVMWGIGIWGITHALVNAHAAAVTFFGSLAATALIGTVAIDRKRARAYGEQWQSFRAQTSNVPLVALLAGRTKFAFGELGWWRILLAFVLFVAVFFAHRWLFGISPVPGMTH